MFARITRSFVGPHLKLITVHRPKPLLLLSGLFSRVIPFFKSHPFFTSSTHNVFDQSSLTTDKRQSLQPTAGVSPNILNTLYPVGALFIYSSCLLYSWPALSPDKPPHGDEESKHQIKHLCALPIVVVSPLPRWGIVIYSSCPLYSWQAFSPP